MDRGAWQATVHRVTKTEYAYMQANAQDSELPLQGAQVQSLVTAAAAAKSLQSCPTLCDPIDSSPPGFPRPWDSPGKNTGVGCKNTGVSCHFLL